MAYFWNCFFLEMLITKNTPEQIIFNDAKYLTREIEKEQEEENKRQKALKESEKHKIKLKETQKTNKIKDYKISDDRQFSYEFQHKFQLEYKKDDLSFAGKNLNDNLEIQMSVDKIYELRKYQNDFDAKFINLHNYSQIFNNDLQPISDSDLKFDFENEFKKSNSLFSKNDLELKEIQVEIASSKGME